MRIIISSKNITLTDDIRDLFEKKAGKLERYLRPDAEMLVTFSREGARDTIEVTIPFDGGLLRAEETGYDIFTCVDEVLEKIEKQIRRHRTRLERRLKEDAFAAPEPVYFEEDEEEEQEEGIRIVRTKRFAVKPMDAYEAVEQMLMLGHAFFVYQDAETGGINVVYKRHDDTYGLIEPELD
ncbi:MAG: ribosome-associated translation inhibitor RaiA [Clostridia bacterium]|nr:ribosome-associated translation inhibitor RaiA [Clostridia bacterium]